MAVLYEPGFVVAVEITQTEQRKVSCINRGLSLQTEIRQKEQTTYSCGKQSSIQHYSVCFQASVAVLYQQRLVFAGRNYADTLYKQRFAAAGRVKGESGCYQAVRAEPRCDTVCQWC